MVVVVLEDLVLLLANAPQFVLGLLPIVTDEVELPHAVLVLLGQLMDTGLSASEVNARVSPDCQLIEGLQVVAISLLNVGLVGTMEDAAVADAGPSLYRG